MSPKVDSKTVNLSTATRESPVLEIQNYALDNKCNFKWSKYFNCTVLSNKELWNYCN